tara:strand:+ start:162 stop:620 length:459 start_codon:yes stop_codon:yes gene_type:complete
MADKKVTALTDLGDSLAAVDLFHVVDDPAGTPINKKIAAQDVFNNIPSWLGLAQTSQAITSSGSSSAADVTSAITEVNGTSAVETITLADGSDGQVKIVLDTATAGTYAQTITPSNLRGYTSVLLNAPGESVTLIFKNSNWNILGGNGYATA